MSVSGEESVLGKTFGRSHHSGVAQFISHPVLVFHSHFLDFPGNFYVKVNTRLLDMHASYTHIVLTHKFNKYFIKSFTIMLAWTDLIDPRNN